MNTEWLFDRSKIVFSPLSERANRVDIVKSMVDFTLPPEPVPEMLQRKVSLAAEEIIRARKRGAAVVCAFGAHAVKNGLGPLLGEFARRGWFTHLATNGAGIIHDWEFAYQGMSSENVKENVQVGKFGTWEETGYYINLALAVGAYEGRGYGESIGAFITRNGLNIPPREELLDAIGAAAGMESASVSGSAEMERLGSLHPLRRCAAAADLLEIVTSLQIPEGFLEAVHPYAHFSVQKMAYLAEVPFTSHPMFGHDIIYTHAANRGAAVGRTGELDFLAFAHSISHLEGGVYFSVGSAVMSPMIFEKSLSMARNVLLQQEKTLTDCGIHVVDLQGETWDWSRGEPPADNPAYYLRFMKSFSRMGCRTDYTAADNRSYLLGLFHELERKSIT
ncbi:MAG: hypothetical protein K9L21_04000 [Spirochaetia bacterium]|nr:hypothetical protein [Spirochaetia bacterium]